jgi:hypothetical protein
MPVASFCSRQQAAPGKSKSWAAENEKMLTISIPIADVERMFQGEAVEVKINGERTKIKVIEHGVDRIRLRESCAAFGDKYLLAWNVVAQSIPADTRTVKILGYEPTFFEFLGRIL